MGRGRVSRDCQGTAEIVEGGASDLQARHRTTFFSSYRGKRVVFGHTPATRLPQHLSVHTPQDPGDVFLAGDVIGIDTGCGSGGFLSAVER